MQRRIRQVLVHSCLYYEFDTNIISDSEYDRIGKELVGLIKRYPEYLNELEYGYAFRNYLDMPSGFDLPYRHPDIMRKAKQLLRIRGLL